MIELQFRLEHSEALYHTQLLDLKLLVLHLKQQESIILGKSSTEGEVHYLVNNSLLKHLSSKFTLL